MCGGPWNAAGRCAKDLNCLRTCRCSLKFQPGVEQIDCVFPFKFKGKTYASCTKDNTVSGNAWCATEVDSTGTVVDGKWGECDSSCNDQQYCQQNDFFNQEGRCIQRDIVEPQLQVQVVRYKIDENCYGHKHNTTNKCVPEPRQSTLHRQEYLERLEYRPLLPMPPMIPPEPGLVGVPGLPVPRI